LFTLNVYDLQRRLYCCFMLPSPTFGRGLLFTPSLAGGRGVGVRAMPLIIPRLIQRPHPCPSPARGRRVLTAYLFSLLTAQTPSFCACGKHCFLLPSPAGGRGAGGEGNAVDHSTADPAPSSLPFSRVREKGSKCKLHLSFAAYCANASNCAPSVT
jgi:hypothetical protein